MITIILPAYNEKENLPILAEKIMRLGLKGTRLMIVDDNSPDGTGDIADRLAGR